MRGTCGMASFRVGQVASPRSNACSALHASWLGLRLHRLSGRLLGPPVRRGWHDASVTNANLLVLWDVDHTLIENGGVSKEMYARAYELLTGESPSEQPETDGR